MLKLLSFSCIFVQLIPLFQFPLQDLFSIGITALGPRKKIINSILELRKETTKEKVARQDAAKNVPVDASTKPSKLITDYFICPVSERKKVCASDRARPPAIDRVQTAVGRTCSSASCKRIQKKNPAKSAKSKDIPMWCSIPGTPFRVVNTLNKYLLIWVFVSSPFLEKLHNLLINVICFTTIK